jgi:hypothetical protein
VSGGEWSGTNVVNWQSRAFTGIAGNTSPVIDANGWTYVLDSQGYLTAYYRYGPYWAPVVFRKKLTTQGTATGGGLIVGSVDGDGRLYVPSTSGTFYTLDRPESQALRGGG